MWSGRRKYVNISHGEKLPNGSGQEVGDLACISSCGNGPKENRNIGFLGIPIGRSRRKKVLSV